MSSEGIRTEDEQIKAIKQLPELQSVQDIQVFLEFANFYKRFIQEFSQITAPLTSMLKTPSTRSAKPRKGGIRVGGDNRAGRDGSEIDRSGIDHVEFDSGKVRDDEIEKKGQKTSKSKNLSKSKKTIELDFLIFGDRLAFTELRQAFVKAPIFHHFDPKRYIQIGTDTLGYVISEVLN